MRGYYKEENRTQGRLILKIMGKDEKKGILGFLQRFMNVEEEEQVRDEKEHFEENSIEKRIWRRDDAPMREKVLLGKDDKGNLVRIVFYGRHKWDIQEMDGKSVNVLREHITYTNIAVFRGINGLLPSFENVKILDGENSYLRDGELPKMYYSRGISRDWGYRGDDDFVFRYFADIPEQARVQENYFKRDTYEEFYEKVKNYKFPDVTMLGNVEDAIQISDHFSDYKELMMKIVLDGKLYNRQKWLGQLIDMDPPKEIYDEFLKFASPELVSGLFLELARRGIDHMKDFSELVVKNGDAFSSEGTKGILRCAQIYRTRFNPEMKKSREKEIEELLPGMDLKLLNKNGKPVEAGVEFSGAEYMSFAKREWYKKETYHYDYESRSMVRKENPEKFAKNEFTDGNTIDVVRYKSLIQEAEIYGMPETIGKIAYYLDAPRMEAYFRANTAAKQKNYLKKQVRRIIDRYGREKPEFFVRTMESLLISYREDDYICKFKGNFQFNMYIREYLYGEFDWNPPRGWDYWQEREVYMRNDQLQKLSGRYDKFQGIWNENIQVALNVAGESKVVSIIKAMYFIIKESNDGLAIMERDSVVNLVKYTKSSYEPFASAAEEILISKLDKMESFDEEITLGLIESEEERYIEIAYGHYKNTQGRFSVLGLMRLIKAEGFQHRMDIIEEEIMQCSYTVFEDLLKSLIRLDNDKKEELSENGVLGRKICSLDTGSRETVVRFLADCIKWSKSGERGLFRNLIFTLSSEKIYEIFKDSADSSNLLLDIREEDWALKLIKSIIDHTIPNGELISWTIKNGEESMLRVLAEVLHNHREDIANDSYMIMTLIESGVYSYECLAREVFQGMDIEKRQEVHLLIMDSPKAEVLLYGIDIMKKDYKERIPDIFLYHMMEHGSKDMKREASERIERIIEIMDENSEDIFIYFAKSVLYRPNKMARSKKLVIDSFERFLEKFPHRKAEVEKILQDVGASNIVKDSEDALVMLLRIRRAGV